MANTRTYAMILNGTFPAPLTAAPVPAEMKIEPAPAVDKPQVDAKGPPACEGDDSAGWILVGPKKKKQLRGGGRLTDSKKRKAPSPLRIEGWKRAKNEKSASASSAKRKASSSPPPAKKTRPEGVIRSPAAKKPRQEGAEVFKEPPTKVINAIS